MATRIADANIIFDLGGVNVFAVREAETEPGVWEPLQEDVAEYVPAYSPGADEQPHASFEDYVSAVRQALQKMGVPAGALTPSSNDFLAWVLQRQWDRGQNQSG